MLDPSAVLAPIKANPDDESAWLALAAHYRDSGRHDEAAAVRVFWPTIRSTLSAGRSLESALDLLARNAALLGRRARETDGRASS
jgi:hypothetical protein